MCRGFAAWTDLTADTPTAPRSTFLRQRAGPTLCLKRPGNCGKPANSPKVSSVALFV